MKIIIFQGGLGNQIFEYAFYQYVKAHIDSDVYVYVRGKCHNGFELTKWFDTDIKYAKGFRFLLFRLKEYLRYKGKIKNPWLEESRFMVDSPALCYDGYWQDRKYFTKDFIRFKEFPLSERNQKILEIIKSTQSVSIHVRRGDYLLPQYKKKYSGVCTRVYYVEAINIVKSICDDPRFFIFSDDIDWVKEHLPLDNASYIDWNSGSNSIYDMYLMSKCKINIIANSTFSFWAAYLNTNGKMVIAPKKWFGDGFPTPNIIPDTWMRL